MTIASASGNVFAYAWEDEVPLGFDGASWSKRLCPRDGGLGLDGLFLLSRPRTGEPWVLEHWDTDGSHSFCSNGSRAAAALAGAPGGDWFEALSSGERIQLRRSTDGIGIRMPEGPGFGLQACPLPLDQPAICGWIGNPQLIMELPRVLEVDFPAIAPPLRHHAAFRDGTNVNILEVLAPGEARIRSWERGVEGETLCCGTGSAVAGAWLAQRTGLAHWRIQPAGRDPVLVTVELQPDGTWKNLWLTGIIRIIGQFLPDNDLFS